jgi:hypothetical protein
VVVVPGAGGSIEDQPEGPKYKVTSVAEAE